MFGTEPPATLETTPINRDNEEVGEGTPASTGRPEIISQATAVNQLTR